MKLLTAQNLKDLAKYPLYSQDGKRYDAVCSVKFFLGGYTWYALEFDGEDTFFGLVFNGMEGEYGYFSLKEMSSVRTPMGLTVERDRHFEPTTLSDLAMSEPYIKKYIEEHPLDDDETEAA